MVLDELQIVSNQNLSIEMFLIRLIYLTDSKKKNDFIEKNNLTRPSSAKIDLNFTKEDAIDQIKNITQEKKVKPKIQTEIKGEKQKNFNSFNHLLEICIEKKESKLKYELEKNVNLVKFENLLKFLLMTISIKIL